MGVVLIVGLLAWTVNLRVLACSGIPSRAAVVAQAGTPPAAKPEPSPSRHNCCPKEAKDSRQAQPSSFPKCVAHANVDFSCCSLAATPQSRPPLQKSSRAQLSNLSAEIVRLHSLDTVIVFQAATLFRGFPIWNSSPPPVLRL